MNTDEEHHDCKNSMLDEPNGCPNYNKAELVCNRIQTKNGICNIELNTAVCGKNKMIKKSDNIGKKSVSDGARYHPFRMKKSQSTDYLDVQVRFEEPEVHTRTISTQTTLSGDVDESDEGSQVEMGEGKLDKMMSKSLNLIYCASDDAYVIFLKNHQCSELMPTSGKVLVLDSALTIRKAFYALVFNDTRAALISSMDRKGRPQFIGVLSISDFLELITLYYRSRNEKIHELEDLSIKTRFLCPSTFLSK